MAVAFRSKALTSGITGTEPAGATTDDILIVSTYWEDNSSSITPPAGWSNVFGSNTISTQRISATAFSSGFFWIRRGASAPSYAFTFPNLSSDVLVLCYSGAINSGNPFSFATTAVRDDTSAGTYPAVSGTTDQANEMLVWFGTQLNGTTTFVPPTGFTARESTGSADSTAAEKAQASAGATGSITGASGFANGAAISFMCGLSPTTVGGGSTFVPNNITVSRAAVNRAGSW